MNDLKKIFLFLAVLMIVLIPGFNKLQAAETVAITNINPANQQKSVQFQPLQVDFTTNFDVASQKEIKLSWSCSNLELKQDTGDSNGYNIYNILDQDITGLEPDKIVSLWSGHPSYPNTVIWQVNNGKILPQGLYKIKIAEILGDDYLKTGNQDDVCTITLNVDGKEGMSVFTVGSAGNPTIGFSSPTYNLNENAGVQTIPVNLSFASAKAITVDYTVTPTGATTPADYVLNPAGPNGTLTFPAGGLVQNFNITIIDDTIDDDNEKVEITLSNAKDADLIPITITQSKTTINIIDNEGAPPPPSGGELGAICNPGDTCTKGTCTLDPNMPATTYRCIQQIGGPDNKIGKSCSPSEVIAICGSMYIVGPGSVTDAGALSSAAVPLICANSFCSVPPEYVSLGSWCNMSVNQCEDNSSTLEYTCDTGDKRCIAGVSDMSCTDDRARLNKDVNLSIDGLVGKDILESQRCDEGLLCDGATGVCVNDFGQGAIPSDKLGETADDIRDQIRNIINIALGFLGVAGVIVVIYGGAIWLSAAGDDEKVGKAKKTIIAGMIGLVIIGIAWTVVSYVLTITEDIS